MHVPATPLALAGRPSSPTPRRRLCRRGPPSATRHAPIMVGRIEPLSHLTRRTQHNTREHASALACGLTLCFVLDPLCKHQTEHAGGIACGVWRALPARTRYRCTRWAWWGGRLSRGRESFEKLYSLMAAATQTGFAFAAASFVARQGQSLVVRPRTLSLHAKMPTMLLSSRRIQV